MKSTETALTLITSNLLSSSTTPTILILLDMSAALDHNILLHRISEIMALQLFNSYITNRLSYPPYKNIQHLLAKHPWHPQDFALAPSF